MEKRALQRHLSAQWSGRSFPLPEQRADLGGQNPPTAVILERDLAMLDAQSRCGGGVQDLLDLLKLDEVIARADAPEPQPGHLHHQPWQLAPDPLGTAVRIE